MPSRGAAAAPLVIAAGAALLAAACGVADDRGPAGLEAAGPLHDPVPAVRAAAGPPDETVRAGAAIYRRERCDRCHTLFDAPAPDGPFDLPVVAPPSPGASRVGPDLGREGHRHSDDWHYAHLYAPDVLVPGSRMPASRHLFDSSGDGPPRPTVDGARLVAWMQWLGRDRRDLWAEFRSAEPDIPPPLSGGAAAARRRERAAALYGAHCAACHGASGDGRGPAAALLVRPPRDFTRAAFRFRSVPIGEPIPDRDLFRAITIGSGTGAAMPSFAHLAAEDRWALVGAVRGFAIETSAPARGAGSTGATSAASTPVPAPGAAGEATTGGDDPSARGERLYAAWGCAACHAEAARGRPAPVAVEGAGPAWRDEADRPIAGTSDLRHPCAWRGGASPGAFERVLRFGVGSVMPSYAALIEAEPEGVAALYAYLLSLDPERAAGPGRLTVRDGPGGVSPARGTTGIRSSR